MYDRRDTGYEECTTGGLQEMRIEEFMTGGVQDIRNARQEGCRTRGMHDRRDAGHGDHPQENNQQKLHPQQHHIMENFINSIIASWKTSSTATQHHGKLHPQQHDIIENFIHSNMTSWKTTSTATSHHGKLHPMQHDIMENFIHSIMTSLKTSSTAT